MFHLLRELLHPTALAAGFAAGYLASGSISQAIAWVKSKI